jgi:hypothetical protein
MGPFYRFRRLFIGMTGFGASAPYKELYEHFGITPQPQWPRSKLAYMTKPDLINGFGRIGRNVLRAIYESGRTDIDIVASTISARSKPTPT